MGLFDQVDLIKTGGRKITKHFLTTHGWKEIKWGSPSTWKREPIGCKCWEKIVGLDEEYVDGVLYYFPETFTGYVTTWGFNSQNKCLGWLNGMNSTWDLHSNASRHIDLIEAENIIKQKIKEYYE